MQTTQEIIQKLWGLCDVLRDDGITYHQYLNELTYLLFLKMAAATETEEGNIPEEYRWDKLVEMEGLELKEFYNELLLKLPQSESASSLVRAIYYNAVSNIDEPRNLHKLITRLNELEWQDAKENGLGDLYEGLLEKNAGEKKSGAGQYFTPRPLIELMVRLMEPKVGERCNDPACGTFGFMIAADRYLRNKVDYYNLNTPEGIFQKKEAFSGCELVNDARRLALMNQLLHDMEGEIKLGDTLSSMGKEMKDYDLVLANPPFGNKTGGERPARDDFTISTSNKQLAFLMHIYRSLSQNGKARAAVVLPDNVLFQTGDGKEVRMDLINKCNLHTILRLPTGIFYAQGVKTNVLFFTRGSSDKGNTKVVRYYDMRTNMPSFGKTNPLKEEHFKEFEEGYHASVEELEKEERWSSFTIEEIAAKEYNLDLGLIKDKSVMSYEDLPHPVESAEAAVTKLEQAADLMQSVIKELKHCGL